MNRLCWLAKKLYSTNILPSQNLVSLSIWKLEIFFNFCFWIYFWWIEFLQRYLIVATFHSFLPCRYYFYSGILIENRKDGLPRCDCVGNIKWLSERSETLITYAIWGVYEKWKFRDIGMAYRKVDRFFKTLGSNSSLPLPVIPFSPNSTHILENICFPYF